jgi:hypothetical protein
MNDPLPLEELLAPLAEGEFLWLLRECKLTHLRGTHRDRYTNLVGWQALLRLIEGEEHPRASQFRITRESVLTPSEHWMTGGKVDGGKLEQRLAAGDSIVINHLQQNVPFLATLCNDIKARLFEFAHVGVIITTGDAGAFKLHYDTEDLIILQIEGSKRWQISGPVVSHPVRGLPKQKPPEASLIFDEVLEPGDFLFVPAGHWHHCCTESGRSVHLGIFFVPPTFVDAVKGLTAQLFSNEIFRTPLTRVETVAELEALESAVHKRLIEKIGQLKLREFLAEWNDKLKASSK